MSPEEPGCIAVGKMPIQFEIKMKRKRVTPSGTNFLPRSPITDVARSETISWTISQNTCSLPGTPSVTLEVILNIKKKKIAAATTVERATSYSKDKPKMCAIGWTPTEISLAEYNI